MDTTTREALEKAENYALAIAVQLRADLQWYEDRNRRANAGATRKLLSATEGVLQEIASAFATLSVAPQGLLEAVGFDVTAETVERDDLIGGMVEAMQDADVSINPEDDDAWDMAVAALQHVAGIYTLTVKPQFAKSSTEPDTDMVEPVKAILLKDTIEHYHDEYGHGRFATSDAVVDLYTHPTPLFRKDASVSLRRGEYGELRDYLRSGGMAIGAITTRNYSDGTAVSEVVKMFFRSDAYVIERGIGSMNIRHRDAFVPQCEDLGLQYVLIQPEP